MKLSKRAVTKLTPKERATARAIQLGPWVAWLVLTLPVALFFFYRYLSLGEGVQLLFALTSLAIGAIAAVLVSLGILAYRRGWAKRLRNRLAADGITADEVVWFQGELTGRERKSLKAMDANNPALADAFRETLAVRLMNTRLLQRAKRDLTTLEQRSKRAATLPTTERGRIEAELVADRRRLSELRDRQTAQQSVIEGRLQLIEAAASRSALFADTNLPQQHISTATERVPLALEAEAQSAEFRQLYERELKSLTVGEAE